MMVIRPRQLSRMGMFYLQEAILDVLYEHYNESYGIGAADISRRAGIYRDPGPSVNMNDAIVTGVLNSLHHEGKVERTRTQQHRNVGGWRLTRSEYDLRNEEV